MIMSTEHIEEKQNTENTPTTPNKKKTMLIISSAVIVICVVLSLFFINSDERNYNKAVEQYQSKNYSIAYDMFVKLNDYNDSLSYAQKCDLYIKINNYAEVQNYIDAVNCIEESKDIFEDSKEFQTMLDEYKYLLAKQQYENKNYVEAYNNLISNNHKYAPQLLKELEPLYNSEKATDDILETFQWMSDWLDKLTNKGTNYYETQLIISSGAEWDTFYINRGAAIVNLQSKLKTKSIDECGSDIKDLIGYVPNSKDDCEKILSDLQETFITKGGFNKYNGYFLYYVMSYINESDYVSITRDDSHATLTITQVDKYLKEKNVSAKTFAYMLGVPQMYSMKIEKEHETLKLTFPISSHNYAFCFTGNNKEKDAEISKFLNDSYDKTKHLYESNGYDYFEMDLSGINKYNLDYLRLVFACSETNDPAVILSQDNHFLSEDELKQENIKITIKHDKNAEHYGYYFMADYS